MPHRSFAFSCFAFIAHLIILLQISLFPAFAHAQDLLQTYQNNIISKIELPLSSPELKKALDNLRADGGPKCLETLPRIKGRELSRSEREEFLLVKGICQYAANQLGEAEGTLEELRNLRRSNSDAILFLGLCALGRGKLDQAGKLIDEALWFGSHHALPKEAALTVRAILYEKQSLHDKALEVLNAARAENQKYLPALQLSADLALQQGDGARALPLLRSAKALAPDDDTIKLKTAQALLIGVNRTVDSEKITEARGLTQEIIDRQVPNKRFESAAFPVYVRALAESGAIAEAEKNIEQALKKFPNNQAFLQLRNQLAVEQKAMDNSAPNTTTKQ